MGHEPQLVEPRRRRDVPARRCDRARSGDAGDRRDLALAAKQASGRREGVAMTKRGAIAIAAALWLLEWVTGWSAHLGDTLGSVIGLVWLVMFGYFVVVSRQGKIPRALHTWG